MKSEIKLRLKNELKKLQSMFNRGHGLFVVHLPGKIRYGENGGILGGEVQGSVILIYEDREDLAVSTLCHEYIECCFIVPQMRDWYKVLHHLKNVIAQKDELIHQLLMSKKEEIVDGLALPIAKLLDKMRSN